MTDNSEEYDSSMELGWGYGDEFESFRSAPFFRQQTLGAGFRESLNDLRGNNVGNNDGAAGFAEDIQDNGDGDGNGDPFAAILHDFWEEPATDDASRTIEAPPKDSELKSPPKNSTERNTVAGITNGVGDIYDYDLHDNDDDDDEWKGWRRVPISTHPLTQPIYSHRKKSKKSTKLNTVAEITNAVAGVKLFDDPEESAPDFASDDDSDFGAQQDADDNYEDDEAFLDTVAEITNGVGGVNLFDDLEESAPAPAPASFQETAPAPARAPASVSSPAPVLASAAVSSPVSTIKSAKKKSAKKKSATVSSPVSTVESAKKKSAKKKSATISSPVSTIKSAVKKSAKKKSAKSGSYSKEGLFRFWSMEQGYPYVEEMNGFVSSECDSGKSFEKGRSHTTKAGERSCVYRCGCGGVSVRAWLVKEEDRTYHPNYDTNGLVLWQFQPNSEHHHHKTESGEIGGRASYMYDKTNDTYTVVSRRSAPEGQA
ncbi:MAG: hypothetical protein SGILL_003074 [Bacillariaceae sp.]